MPARSMSIPSRPAAGLQNSEVPKKKKATPRTKSLTQSPASLNLTDRSLARANDLGDLAAALATQNEAENASLLTTRSGYAHSGGNPSLNSTFGTGSQLLTNPANVLVLSPEQEGIHLAHPHLLFEAAPKLSGSHSNGASLFCTPASISLPNAYRDPAASSEPQPEAPRRKKKSVSTENALARTDNGCVRKKAPLRRAAASQSHMFSTSPANSSLERVASPSPRDVVGLTRADQHRPAASLGSTNTNTTGAAAASPVPSAGGAAAAAVVLKKKARTPSPQPLAPSKGHPQHSQSAAAAAATPAAASASSTPVMTTLTPSPQPLEPTQRKALKVSTAKENVRTPPPQSSAAQAQTKAYIPPMNTHESPEYLPTDAPNVVVPARKYAYDVKTCTWKEVDTMIRVLHPNRGVSQGAMRVCFVVEELDERGFSSPMVAKMFRHNMEGIVEADYFNEGEAQCICGIFAEKYNKVQVAKDVNRFVISFLQCDTVRIRPRDLPEEYQNKRSGFFSYRTTDTRDIIFTMEPRLKGNFTKYTNNFGAVYEGFEQRLDKEKELKRHNVLKAVEAFSHFTLEDSGRSMLVCDLQGVNDFLTDPQIHTEDGKGLGMGNMGQRGIDKWVEKHVCNDMCRAMRLPPLAGRVTRQQRDAPNVETRVSYYKVLRSNLRSQAPTRPEDLIPLPKPLSEMTDEERLDYALRLSQLLS